MLALADQGEKAAQALVLEPGQRELPDDNSKKR